MKIVDEKFENCISCVFAIGIALSFLTIPIRNVCRHSKRKSCKGVFEISRVLVALSLCFLIVVVISLASLIYVLGGICRNDKEICYVLTSDLLYCLNGFLAFIFPLMNTKIRVQELNGWSELIEKRTSFGIDCVFNARTGKSFSRVFYHNIGLICAAVLGITLYYYLVLEDDLQFKYGRLFLMLFSLIVSANTLTFMSVQCICFVNIYKIIKQTIEKLLKDNEKKLKNNETRKDSKFLEIRLKSINRFLMAVNLNCQVWKRYYDPTVTIMVCLVIANLVSSLYLYFVCLDVKCLTFLLMIFVRTCFTIFALLHLLVIVQRTSDVTGEMLSILFKYPISKLSAAEATQVEMLIATLTIQKPEMRPSDLFTLGRRLIPTVGGTILTYVLVAIQFRTKTQVL